MATQSPEIENLLRSDFLNQKDKYLSDTDVEMVEISEKNRLDDLKIANNDSLEDIFIAQKELSQVKESLGTIIDAMIQNPSLLTRASIYYGSMDMWKKVGIGVALPLPTLAVGLFAHVGVLLVISGVIAATYTTAGVFLEDHNNCNVNIAERLKAGIFNLSDVLQLTINALDKIRIKLAKEIENFKTENFKLATHVTNLGEHVKELDSQVQVYIETEKMLRATKDDLELTASELKKSVIELKNSESELKQSVNVLEKTQTELKEVSETYKKNQVQLTDKIAELNKVKLELTEEVKKVKTNAEMLQGLVVTLSEAAVPGEKQEEFRIRFEEIISDKERSFHEVAERIGDSERQLILVKNELRLVKDQLFECLNSQNAVLENQKAVCEDQKQLLKEQHRQLDRIEAIPYKAPIEFNPPVPSQSATGNVRFFNNKSPSNTANVKENLVPLNSLAL